MATSVWRTRFYNGREFTIKQPPPTFADTQVVYIGYVCKDAKSIHNERLSIIKRERASNNLFGNEKKMYYWAIYDVERHISTFYTEEEAIDFACRTLLKRENKRIMFHEVAFLKGRYFNIDEIERNKMYGVYLDNNNMYIKKDSSFESWSVYDKNMQKLRHRASRDAATNTACELLLIAEQERENKKMVERYGYKFGARMVSAATIEISDGNRITHIRYSKKRRKWQYTMIEGKLGYTAEYDVALEYACDYLLSKSEDYQKSTVKEQIIELLDKL